MQKLLRSIEERVANTVDKEKLNIKDISLQFFSETNGKLIADYKAKNGYIKKEDKEWTAIFDTDGDTHSFPVSYAYEVKHNEEEATLHYDYEDDEYVVLNFHW